MFDCYIILNANQAQGIIMHYLQTTIVFFVFTITKLQLLSLNNNNNNDNDNSHSGCNGSIPDRHVLTHMHHPSGLEFFREFHQTQQYRFLQHLDALSQYAGFPGTSVGCYRNFLEYGTNHNRG